MQPAFSIKQALARPENVAFITARLDGPAAPPRTLLARELCQRLDFRDPKGDWQIGTTCKALRDLETEGLWKLPAPATTTGSGTWQPRRLTRPVPRPQDVPGRAEEIQGLRLVQVVDDEHCRIWNELMLREHPLHDCRLVGRQLRYLIGSDHGWLGGLGFGSAALYLEDRDDWIGWNEAQRLQYRERVLNMNRFLIRKSVRSENLASRVLGLCAREVQADFQRRYALEPWMLESFVDTSDYDGCCYKAANWIQVGRTKGRGRNGSRRAGKSIKDIYLYPLVDDFPGRVGVERPEPIALEAHCGLDGARWAEQEFGTCELGDPRRTRRLVKIVHDRSAQPGASYAQAAGGNRHQLKAYYRFLNSEREEMEPETLLGTHRSRTIRRMKKEDTVLLLQDTTLLNFSTRAACEGLGQIGTNQTKAISRGLALHSCLAVSGEGLPLGVLRLDGYAPQSAADKDPDRPIEEKESYRWLEAYRDASQISGQLPGTRIVSVADREGDMFELFDLRRGHAGPKAELLVRAKTDRCLEDSDRKLFEELALTPLAAKVTIPVPRQRQHTDKPSTPGRPALAARNAEVEVRFKEVTIRPPQKAQTRHKSPIKVWAIYLVEKNPPEGATAIEWMLLTSIEVASVKQALRCIRWYCRRWRIEEWHRVMKSGCRIMEHQNHSAAVLLRAIALDAVIAWRIMLLTLLGREMPGLPCDIVFDSVECEVLELLAQKKASHSAKP